MQVSYPAPGGASEAQRPQPPSEQLRTPMGEPLYPDFVTYGPMRRGGNRVTIPVRDEPNNLAVLPNKPIGGPERAVRLNLHVSLSLALLQLRRLGDLYNVLDAMPRLEVIGCVFSFQRLHQPNRISNLA